MDIPRNLFGALTSGIIRLLVAVEILAAVYFFILRPVLDTTSEAIKEANKSVETTFGAARIDAPAGFKVTVDAKAGQQLARSCGGPSPKRSAAASCRS